MKKIIVLFLTFFIAMFPLDIFAVDIMGKGVSLSAGRSQDDNIVGCWADDFTDGLLWRIHKDLSVGYVLEIGDIKDTSRWMRSSTLREEYMNGFRVFFDKERPEEFYIVERNGDLSVFDTYGHIATYKKIKF